jgi:hypothetical protein
MLESRGGVALQAQGMIGYSNKLLQGKIKVALRLTVSQFVLVSYPVWSSWTNFRNYFKEASIIFIKP